jgi:hypothetical protein
MTNPTTNFGWQMPTPTDLVTDLPADFEVFGQAVDTDFVDLLGGTTGQILSKTSNTDLDFTWITNDVGDITNVNVTSPITGGGSSGAVTIGINAATTSVVGAVQLSDSTSTTSSVLAATSTAVKAAYDKASTAATTSVAGIVQLSDSTSTTSSVLASTPTATKSAYDLADAAIAKSTVTTAGDVIYRNATVPVRLGIGTAGQVLTVNSGATAPEWATAATGGTWTQIATAALSGASVTISSITGKALMLVFENWKSSSVSYLSLRVNGTTGNAYVPVNMDLAGVNNHLIMTSTKATTDGGFGSIFFPTAGTNLPGQKVDNGNYGGIFFPSPTSSVITSLTFYPSAGTFQTGYYYLWSQS